MIIDVQYCAALIRSEVPTAGQCECRIFESPDFSYSNMLSINLNNFSLWHDPRCDAHTMKAVLDAKRGAYHIWKSNKSIHAPVQFVHHAASYSLKLNYGCNNFVRPLIIYVLLCFYRHVANGVRFFLHHFCGVSRRPVAPRGWTDSEQHSLRVRTTCSPT